MGSNASLLELAGWTHSLIWVQVPVTVPQPELPQVELTLPLKPAAQAAVQMAPSVLLVQAKPTALVWLAGWPLQAAEDAVQQRQAGSPTGIDTRCQAAPNHCLHTLISRSAGIRFGGKGPMP